MNICFYTFFFAFCAQLVTSTEDVYNIYFDGVTATPIPREDVAGPTTEIFYRYRAANNQGIKRVNATHVFVPFYTMLQADYTRDTQVAETSDTGIARQIFSDNPASVIGRYVVIGAAEKLHIQEHTGEWSTAGADRVEEAKDTYTPEMKAEAESAMEDRVTAEMRYIMRSSIGVTLYKSAEDNHHLDAVEEFAAQGDAAQTWAKSEPQRTRLDEVDPHADKEVLRTDNNCWHFEVTEGLGVLSDDSGMYLPLDTHIVSARGQTSYAPDPTFSIVLGVSMFTFDDENDVLEAYVLGSSILYIPNFEPIGSEGLPPSPVKGVLYVGPADGAAWPMAAAFGRDEELEANPSLQELYEEIRSMPYNHGQWERDLEDACPRVKYFMLDRAFSKIDLSFMNEPVWEPKEYLKALVFVPLTSRAVECAIDWTRPPPQYRSSIGSNFLPLTTLAHGLTEITADHRMSSMGGREWDDLQTFDSNLRSTGKSLLDRLTSSDNETR